MKSSQTVRHRGSCRLVRGIGVILTGLLVSLNLPNLASAATPATIVHPGELGGWTVAAGTNPTTVGEFVAGPDGPPAGAGSFRQALIDGADQQKISMNLTSPTGLGSIGELGYSTYVTRNQGGQATAMQLVVDLDGNGTADDTLFFEPIYQTGSYPGDAVPNQCQGITNCAAIATWQTWDADAGGWWSRNGGVFGPPVMTLASYAAANPAVRVLSVAMAAGGGAGAWDRFDGNVDKVVVGTTRYDFEAVGASLIKVHPEALNGWEISNYNGSTYSPGATANGTNSTFVGGPGTPPEGLGSVRQVAKVGEKALLQTDDYNGTAIRSLQLSYATHTATNAAESIRTAVNLSVDNNADGTSDETLVFEPYQQGQALTGDWQNWDTSEGKWWSTRITSGPGSQGEPQTLAAFAALNPSAKLAAAGTALRFVSGSSGSWPNYDGNIDAVRIKNTTFDMESFLNPVDCDTTVDDISAVQAAVDAAPDGYTIKLKGTCNFGAAAPHGGDTTSIESAAVAIRPGSPVNGLTIESDGAPQSATITGSGTQTAFFVAPGSRGVTIRGLRFANLARPIVTVNSTDTTIGAAGGLPSPAANRIIGEATMNSAILAVASDRGFGGSLGTLTLSHGPAAAQKTATFATPSGQKLSGLNVAGNYITYSPPGAPDGAARDIVAVDVRQRGTGTGEGIAIASNAVGFLTSEFPSFNMNAIRVHAHSGDTGYHLRNVSVTGNNLGRLEELGGAADVNAGGRAAIVLSRVDGFSVIGNGLRSRLSPTGGPMPGGGIVVGDSSNGRIADNGIIVLADPTTLDADLGAIGVIEDLNVLFGSTAGGPSSSDIAIDGNIVGIVGDSDAPLGAQRGIVVNGARHVSATRNNIKFASGPAVNLGVAAKGPGSLSSPGIVTLQNAAVGAVVCGNTFEGVADDSTNVQADLASASAFPGTTAGNLACTPTVSVPAGTVGSGGLTVTGSAWSARPVSVAVSDATQPPVTGTATSAANGGYSVTFSASQLAPLADGQLRVIATAKDDVISNLSRQSAARTITKDFTAPVGLDILQPAEGALVPAAVTVAGTSEPGAAIQLHEGTTLLGTTTSNAAGQWTKSLVLSDGPHAVTATATDGSGNSTTSPVRSFTVDAVAPDVPVITAPAGGSSFTASSVTVTGTAEPGMSVKVLDVADDKGTAVADGSGAWVVVADYLDGSHSVKAVATDAAGNTAESGTRSFTVDATPPQVPVIVTPVQDAMLRVANVSLAGSAEPGSLVTISEGSSTVATATAASNGSWSAASLLADGAHSVTATATDAAGHVSTVSPGRSFTVDTLAPAVAVTTVTSPINQTNQTAVIASGTAEPGSTVSVQVTDGTRTSTPKAATVDAAGLWSATDINAASLRNGAVTFTATATDAAGNVGSATRAATKQASADKPMLVIIDNGFGYAGPAQLQDGKLTVEVTHPGPTAIADMDLTVSDGTTTVTRYEQVGRGQTKSVKLDVSTLQDGAIIAGATADAESATAGVTLDRGTPNVGIDAVAPVYLSTPVLSTLEFSGTASDATSPVFSVVARLVNSKGAETLVHAKSSGTAKDLTWEADFSHVFLPHGDYTLKVVAYDEAGNVSPVTTSPVFVI
ncbi:MAG TPA: Ig-like domain-containing protein [Actinomycetota bacterium]|nr:Ig-like domain-containing protein [Actinomycetota bacterium]